MRKECAECHGGLITFDGPCPSCGGTERVLRTARRRQLKPLGRRHLVEMREKLASPEWQRLTRLYRQQARLPAEGLEPGQAAQLLADSVQRLFLAYLVLSPREDVQEEIKQIWGELSPASPPDSTTAFELMAAPWQPSLAVLRLGAAHLAVWLGTDDVGRIMAHLISPKGEPLKDWEPRRAAMPAGPLLAAWQDLAQVLVPFPDELHPLSDSMKTYKGTLLVGFVTGLRERRLKWEDVRMKWNKVFPFWQIQSWRALKTTYRYWKPRRSPSLM